jgi:hypothetical protein
MDPVKFRLWQQCFNRPHLQHDRVSHGRGHLVTEIVPLGKCLLVEGRCHKAPSYRSLSASAAVGSLHNMWMVALCRLFAPCLSLAHAICMMQNGFEPVGRALHVWLMCRNAQKPGPKRVRFELDQVRL